MLLLKSIFEICFLKLEMTGKKVQESTSVQVPTKRSATIDSEVPTKVAKTDENTCVSEAKATDLEVKSVDKKSEEHAEETAVEQPLVEEPELKEAVAIITVTETTVDIVDAKIDGETEAVKVTLETVKQEAEVGAAVNDDSVPVMKTTKSKVEVVIPKPSPGKEKEQPSVKSD